MYHPQSRLCYCTTGPDLEYRPRSRALTVLLAHGDGFEVGALVWQSVGIESPHCLQVRRSYNKATAAGRNHVQVPKIELAR